MLRETRQARKNRHDDRLPRDFIASLPPTSSCVDVGANVGAILAAMVAHCSQGKHIGFEPLPFRRAELQARFPDVEVRGEALSDRVGSTAFTYVVRRDSRSGLTATLDITDDETVEQLTVPTTTLDDALSEGPVPALIKVDVEGPSWRYFEARAQRSKRHRPVVAFEHAIRLDDAPARTVALFRKLADAGYRIWTMRRHEVVSEMELCGWSETESSGTFSRFPLPEEMRGGRFNANR